MGLTRLDGVEFGLWRGARRERCQSIVTDEQRCPQGKIGPPLRGCAVQSRGSVASLAGATGPCRTPRLATGLRSVIKVDQCHVITL